MNNEYQTITNQNINYQNVNQNRKQTNLKPLLYILISILIILIGLIIVFSLNKKDIKTRTFMIYMVGSDLESRGYMGT